MAKGRGGRGSDITLAGVALVLGLAAALGYAAWRAVSAMAPADRWGAFGSALVFPGALIIAGVAVMVWLGWKANID
ncbi:MAG: hypothetical protein KGK07_12360 [Chloroflexota bacterium]|nr:hypothetical protein [Chloroflexota bacterium]